MFGGGGGGGGGMEAPRILLICKTVYIVKYSLLKHTQLTFMQVLEIV